MVSVLLPLPQQLLWFLSGHLDFLCCDPGGDAFLGWSGLQPWHFGPQCPILSHLEQWESHAGQFALLAGCCCVQLGQSLGGSRWCVTIAVVAGVGHSPLVLADGIDRFGAVGDLFPGMLDGKVVHSNISQLAGGCLEWLGHKFPKELSLMAVCMDDMVMQFVLAMLIIDHLTVVHQCLDACDKILGVLSQPGHSVFEFSKMHMGVDVMCHSLLDLVEEGRSFHLCCFLFLFAASRHPLCIHLQGFGSQGCKDISEVVLTVQQDVVEEEPVLQGMAKYGGVKGILGVPVVDGQADGCCPSCQHTSNGIGCGLGRLGDQLWSWF